jgi:hypothetical protein
MYYNDEIETINLDNFDVISLKKKTITFDKYYGIQGNGMLVFPSNRGHRVDFDTVEVAKEHYELIMKQINNKTTKN